MKHRLLLSILLISLLPFSAIYPLPKDPTARDIVKELVQISLKGLLFTILQQQQGLHLKSYDPYYDNDDIYYQSGELNSYNDYDEPQDSHPDNSHIQFFKAGQIKENFKSVAGNQEAKKALQDTLDYLKNPKKYTNMGVCCPAGILLEGPPGTGKTLLAKALAGEANCSFISASGSDFVEMYVGKGAQRVRQVFEHARKHGPCIILLDEFDALARKRGGSADSQEYDHALNQLLAEMDGVATTHTNKPVIVIATTNNKDLLDPAVLRSGRFDKSVETSMPNVQERQDIFMVHLNKVQHVDTIDAKKIAQLTNGFSGADLANLVTQSAFLAIKKNLTKITMEELQEAVVMVQKKLSNDSTWKIYTPGSVNTTFKDVAGNYEAKDSLSDIIHYLKNPKAYYKLGAKPPFGVLLTGAPGTGKTLLARALAGEVNCSFISTSSADFVDQYAGTASLKIKALFKEARKHAPCIIFIDEIDGLGGSRTENGSSMSIDHNQTVNQLLVEMDGFVKNNPETPVIIIGATNFEDMLDPALTRSGRLDKIINISLPDTQCRKEILQVHLKKIQHKLTDHDIQKIAAGSSGFSGADLENLVNQAALIALKQNKPHVTIADFEEARDRILIGDVSPTMKVSQKELEITAYHESGHALIRLLMPSVTDPLHKITIQPRGGTLGVAYSLPDSEKYDLSAENMLANIAIALAGRAAEELKFNHFGAGAYSDFQKATQLARTMVCKYGMSSFGTEVFMPGLYSYSQKTLEKIDNEVARILKEQYDLVMNLLKTNKDKLEKLSQALLKKETLYASEIYTLLGITPRADFTLK